MSNGNGWGVDQTPPGNEHGKKHVPEIDTGSSMILVVLLILGYILYLYSKN